MDPASVPLNPTELLELIGAIAGVGVTGVLGFLVVRRARAARLRQIEASGEPKSAGSLAEAGEEAREEPEQEEESTGETAVPEAAPRRRPAAVTDANAPRSAPTAPTAEERPPQAEKPEKAEKPAEAPAPAAPERPPAQVIPFPVPPAPPPAPVKRKDAAALAPGLARTRSGWISRLRDVFAGRKEIDASIVGEIEKVLLTADIGVRTSTKLLEEIRASLSRRELSDPDAVWAFLRRRSTEMLTLPAPDVDFGSARPFVLLVIGVNGSGKTTTIGKLAAKLGGDGKKVILAAGDTFRAAAAEQLEIWAGRTSAAIVRGKEGADPSSVIFDGIKRAVTDGFDVAIADTAGRLHTKTDLMQELQKVRRVVAKASAGAPHETWLVIDATSGQNAIAQAQIFTEAMQVTGIVLTKLDGTAKGGVILGIADQLKIPVRYVGVGERVEDLRPFDPEEFVEALFAPPSTSPSERAS
jgi:fused signal recognition particle receptor